MWGMLCLLSAVVCVSVGAPQNGAITPPVEIVSQNSAVNADGSYSSSFEAGNGIKIEESGYVKQVPQAASFGASAGAADDYSSGDVQTVQGSFSYTAPDGTLVSLRYVADETGFHPEGDHLPTPPPIPAAIQASLQLLPDTTSTQS